MLSQLLQSRLGQLLQSNKTPDLISEDDVLYIKAL